MITSNRELLFTYLTSLGKEWSLYTSKFSYIQKTIQFSQFYIAACLNQIIIVSMPIVYDDIMISWAPNRQLAPALSHVCTFFSS